VFTKFPLGSRRFPTKLGIPPTKLAFTLEISLKLATRTLAFALALVGGTASYAEGDLKIRFQYGGDAFDPAKINVNDPFCAKQNLVNERLLVNKENKGIENIIVYVFTGRGGSKLPEFEPVKNTHELANLKCRFEPHIVIMQAGDTLKVTNPDPVGHNANIGFFKNEPVNFLLPPMGEKSVELKVAEPAPIPAQCNIHPWMISNVLVVDHPFAAKSDKNGELTIKGLPSGAKLVFRVWSEAGTIETVTIDGKEEVWKSQKFEVDIKDGVNDIGTVVIPKDALKP
jgi:plastocyanin